MKRKKNKKISKNEFRYNYDTKHMNYVFEEDNKRYHALGLTTKSRTKDKNGVARKNMKLNTNPEKDNFAEDSYIRYGYITGRINSFSKKTSKKFAFDVEDFKNVKSKIRKYKSNRKK